MSIKRVLRYYYLRFIRLRGEPGKLARSTAIGIFVGIAPLSPFRTVLLIISKFLFNSSLVASFLSCAMVCNPATYVVNYYIAYELGSMILPFDLSWERINSVLTIINSNADFFLRINAVASLGRDVIITLLSGGIILAVPFTLLAYILSFNFFSSLSKKQRPGRHP
jgi:uncharacterized protein